METTDTTIYLMHWQDACRVTKEYMTTVIQAREEYDAVHAQEKEAMKTSDNEDPVVQFFQMTHRVAQIQANKAVDVFLKKIKKTLKEHVLVGAHDPLMANTLRMAM